VIHYISGRRSGKLIDSAFEQLRYIDVIRRMPDTIRRDDTDTSLYK
jgi:hypothetical protein